MLVVSAVWVKLIRFDKTSLVTTARGKQKDHRRTLWDSNTSDIDISKGSTNTKVHRRIKAQYLFDRTRKDHKQIRYIQIISVLTKIVKEQDKKMRELEEKLGELSTNNTRFLIRFRPAWSN